MKGDYSVIEETMGKPLYYDIHGVPVYTLPLHLLDDNGGIKEQDDWQREKLINFCEEQLIEVGCQGCNQRFIVQMCDPVYTSEIFKSYGDPPRHGDCCSGDTMGAVEYRKLGKFQIGKFISDAKNYKNSIDIEE